MLQTGREIRLSQLQLFKPRTHKVLTAASMKMTGFWDDEPCSLVGIDRRFVGVYCLHHQSEE
jgi:hypothetical protein